MRKFEGYLLISDMDGTLLNHNKEISLENKKAIAEFIEEGGKFAVATGRSPQSARRWLEQLPINASCIFYNGSMVKNLEKNQVLDCAYLNRQYFIPFIQWILSECEEVVVEIFTQQGLYVVSNPEVKDPYLEQEKDPYIESTLSHVAEQNWIKVLLCSSHERLERIEQKLLNQALNHHCNYFYSQDFFLELTPENHSKGTALKTIRDKGEHNKIIAVGDYDNDLEMLKEADFGVAVGNAQESLKKAADYVATDHNHHPMEDIVKRLSERR